MKKDYTRKIEEAQEGAPYVATKTKGKDGHFEKYNLTKRLNEMESKLNLLMGFYKARASIGKEVLERNGKRGTNSELGNDYNMVQNSDMILDGEEAYAITFLNGYVDKYIMATKIYHNELPEGFSADGTWFINADGILERDMKRVAEQEEL